MERQEAIKILKDIRELYLINAIKTLEEKASTFNSVSIDLTRIETDIKNHLINDDRILDKFNADDLIYNLFKNIIDTCEEFQNFKKNINDLEFNLLEQLLQNQNNDKSYDDIIKIIRFLRANTNAIYMNSDKNSIWEFVEMLKKIDKMIIEL